MKKICFHTGGYLHTFFSWKIIKFMRNIMLLIFITSFQAYAEDSFSQDARLTLDLRNVTLAKALENIENQSDYYFLFNAKLINIERKVSVSTQNEKISDILNSLFAGTDVDHIVYGRQIILSPKHMTTTQSLQQEYQVKGKVTDATGSPLPGVNVVVKGTTTGTITDLDGNYVLNNVSPDAILVYSFVGMKTEEVAVDGKTIMDIKMQEETVGIEEVVAIGYGTQRKKDITGSVDVVNMNDLKKIVSSSAQEALQGFASGVNVVSSGAPGLDSKILIRGVTSFGDASPLVIVDGIEQDLNNIDANDIESIQVLKDAGAASIYGVRGSNGVIVVTTKKGKEGAPVVSYDAYYGMTYPLSGNPFNLLNSDEFMKIYNIAIPGNELFAKGMPDYTYRGPSGAGVGFEGDPEVDPANYFYESPNTGKNYIIQKVNKKGEDWFHDLFKKAPRQNHNITVSGGTEKAKYLFALGYMNQQGTAVNTSLKRISARINTEYSISNWLKVGENANLIYRSTPGFSNQVEFGGLSDVYKQFPIIPLKDIMGHWAGSFGGPDLGTAGNPVANQYRDIENDVDRQWYIIGNAFAEITFLKGFTARTSIGYNIENAYYQDYSACQPENVQGSTNPDNLSISSNYGSTMTFTNTLNYHKEFGEHNINALIGSEAIEYTGRGHAGSSSGFFSNDFNFLVLGNGTSSITNSSWVSENSLFSLFARLDYAFMDKYLLGATVRRDGSSKFGPDKRYGVFPSFSLGWRISKEEFMKNISWLDDLKIRGSYGVLGSQNNVSASNAYSLFDSGLGWTYYDINGTGNSVVLGFAESQIGNAATGWEKDKVTNLGFDAVVLNHKLNISAEYFRKEINGLLFSEPLPAVVVGGASAPTINIGNVRNTGVDIAVNYRGKITNDLHFSAGLNVTTYKNMIKDIPDPGYFYAGGLQDTWDYICRNEEGHPMSAFYGYKVIGLFNNDDEVANAPTQDGAAPGRFRYQDTDKDGEITDADRVFIGDPNPDFTYGIPVSLDYKNFDLSAFFYGSYGNDIYNTTRTYLDFFQYYIGNKSKRLLDAWTPEHKNTTVPKVENTKSFSNCVVSNSYFIEDGSYFRLKSLTLGYNVKSSLLQKFKISKLRLYIEGTNLFTITKYSGLDPELGGYNSSFGIDYGNYPDCERGVIFGINASF